MRELALVRNLALIGIGATLLANPLHAEVTFDGTLGPAGTLSGNFDIPDSFGTQVDSNLFHSFSTFNINTGESATFTSSFAGVTDNVIGRVTGGSLSTIDGLLASTIPGAAIWLINPNGIVFDDNASLSVPGAFHVSTADYLLLEDGGRFDATNVGETVLTMANPVTFGFLSMTPTPISVGASALDLEPGADISFVGGDITLTNTTINAPGGRINLASAASAGELSLEPDGIGVNDVSSFGDVSLDAASIVGSADNGGDIFIRGGQFFMDRDSFIAARTTGEDPADRGGDIVLDVDDASILNSSQISTTTFAAGTAGNITLRASGDVLIQGDTAGSPAGIFANSHEGATGDGGDILLSATNLSIIEGGIVGAITFGAGATGSIDIDLTETLLMRSTLGLFDSDILANANLFFGATGDVGSVDITATDVIMELGALIQAQTIEGNGGTLTVNADTLSITGASQMATGTSGSGNGGALTINARDINVSGFQFVPGVGFLLSGLFADTSGSGNGGIIDINASDMMVADFALIAANVQWPSTGLGGQISVDTDRLTISNGAFISAGSLGAGDSGNVSVTATENILIDGQFQTCCNFTGIFANTFGNASAGVITVTTPELEVRDGGFIQAGSFNSFDPFATGTARDIVVNVDNLLIDAGFISASTWTSGNAGTVIVNATGTVTLQNSSGHVFAAGNSPVGGLVAESGAFFTSSLATGNAGDIIVNANELILLDGGAITAQTITAGNAGSIRINANSLSAHSDENPFTLISNNTGIGSGDAGSINIDVNDMTVTGLASIQAATVGFGGVGNGGAINILADNLTLANGGSITALTQSIGNAGAIDIDVSGTFSASGGDENPLGFGNVSSASFGSGDGGTLSIAADNIVIDDAGVISVQAIADGTGGDLIIEGRIIDISNSGTVSASATGTGNAGTVIIIAVDDLTVTNASIETSSAISAGGNMDIQVGQMLFLNEGGLISAAAGGVTQTDDGGNILIDPVFVILRESSILATANAGNGGNIDIQAGSFIIDADSVIDASSQTGLDGRITIDTVNNIYGSVLLLETPAMAVPDVITQKCVAAAFRDRSSLTVEQRESHAWSPEDYLPSPLREASAASVAASSSDECRFSLIVENAIDAT
jgi:filamentous hemagglutinin family protein